MLRTLAYVWAAPNTAIGLGLVLLAIVAGGQARIVAGVVEAHGGPLAWLLRRMIPLPGGAAAVTIGHVVLARSASDLDRTRAHERVHVRQYERWGPAFLVAYAIASGVAAARGDAAYRDNCFEREAYAADEQHDDVIG